MILRIVFGVLVAAAIVGVGVRFILAQEQEAVAALPQCKVVRQDGMVFEWNRRDDGNCHLADVDGRSRR
jgi:hypothetical protein